MNKYYPVMLKIENKLCTVIGGGHVAERKVHGLLNSDATVRLVAPEILESIRVISGIEIRNKKYEPQDIIGSFIVIAATNDKDLNKKILSDAAGQGILAMSVDGDGDFINGAVHREGGITIQVSTGVPVLSAHICRNMKLKAYAAAASVLSKYRKRIKYRDYKHLLSRHLLRMAERNPEKYKKKVRSQSVDT